MGPEPEKRTVHTSQTSKKSVEVEPIGGNGKVGDEVIQRQHNTRSDTNCGNLGQKKDKSLYASHEKKTVRE